MKSLELYAVCHHKVQNCIVSSHGFVARRVLSSDGTEDDLEAVELEQQDLQDLLWFQGQGQNQIQKHQRSFRPKLPYIDPAFLCIIPVLFLKAVWPYYAHNYAGIMYTGLAVGETLVRPTDMHD